MLMLKENEEDTNELAECCYRENAIMERNLFLGIVFAILAFIVLIYFAFGPLPSRLLSEPRIAMVLALCIGSFLVGLSIALMDRMIYGEMYMKCNGCTMHTLTQEEFEKIMDEYEESTRSK